MWGLVNLFINFSKCDDEGWVEFVCHEDGALYEGIAPRDKYEVEVMGELSWVSEEDLLCSLEGVEGGRYRIRVRRKKESGVEALNKVLHEELLEAKNQVKEMRRQLEELKEQLEDDALIKFRILCHENKEIQRILNAENR